MASPAPHREDAPGVLYRSDLRPDCERCVGFCCVVPAFAASRDFALNKPAGQPCPNLTVDSRCRIHDELSDRGFRGCVAYECFGAGQRVTQASYGGRDWRQESAEQAEEMFATFRSVERLAAMAWHLREATGRTTDGALTDELGQVSAHTERLMSASPQELAGLDLDSHQRAAGELLDRVSRKLRSRYGHPLERRGADLAATDLRKEDLRGADLRGACLIRADLRGVDLAMADLLGADIRDALVADADLSEALFLTQPQLETSVGSTNTRIPEWASRPVTWQTEVTFNE